MRRYFNDIYVKCVYSRLITGKYRRIGPLPILQSLTTRRNLLLRPCWLWLFHFYVATSAAQKSDAEQDWTMLFMEMANTYAECIRRDSLW